MGLWDYFLDWLRRRVWLSTSSAGPQCHNFE